MKVVNPFEIILSGNHTCLVNRGKVFDMHAPDPEIDVTNAEENAWKEAGHTFEFSDTTNKLFVDIKKEAPPNRHIPSALVRRDIESFPDPHDPEITVTKTTLTYFMLGEIYSAEAKIASDFPSSDDDKIIIKVAEVDEENKKVTQYCMSDIFVLNPLVWIIEENEDSDSDESDDSDSDSSDSDESDDSDSDEEASDESDES